MGLNSYHHSIFSKQIRKAKVTMVFKDIKRISKNSFGFSIGLILTNAIGFILLPVYTRYLTPADYGIISVAGVVSAILSIICIFGMRGAISRFYFDYYKDPGELREYLSTICITVFSLSFSLILIIFLFGEPLFTLILPDIPFYPYLAIVLWTTLLGIPLNFAFILLQARERSFFYSFINICKFLLTTICILFFIIIYLEGALGSLKGQLIGAFIFFFVGIALLWNDIGLVFNPDKLRESLKFGIPMVPHELADWTSSMIDRIFLSNYSTLTVVGLYSLGYQFGVILSFVTTAINFAWVPYFMSSAKELGEKARPTFATLTTYYMVFILFIGLGITLFSNIVIEIMATPDFYDAAKIVPIITLSFIFGGMYYMVVNQLFFLKRSHYIMYSTVMAACINVGMNALLIPKFGMIGAGIATALSYFSSFIFVYYFSNKLFPIPYDYRKIVKTCMLTFSIYAISLFIPMSESLLEFSIKCILMVIYIMGLLCLRIITLNEIYTLKNNILNGT